MDIKKTQKIINSNIRDYLDPMQKLIHNPAVKLDGGNSPEHELKKTEICLKLIMEGLHFVTEAKLKNGKKPDILVLDVEPPIAYEIQCSESDRSIEEKNKTYGNITVIPIKVEKKDEKYF